MDILHRVLWPLTEVLRLSLELLLPLLGSYGISIVVLAILVSSLLSPITGMARRLEAVDTARQLRMAPDLDEAKRTLRGRERFERIEEIYQQNNYHPIKSLGSLLPLLIQLPFLLAALFLLTEYPPISGESFGVIRDLSAPDGLLSLGSARINLLPIAVTGVAIVESWVRRESTESSRRRFLIVAFVLFILIYPFAAAVCLYWLTSNLMSLGRSVMRRGDQEI